MAANEEIKVIYEDDWILVLDKPAGVVSTNENGRETNTVEDWLKDRGYGGLKRGGLVHRLDKNTSGILISAKDEKTLGKLKLVFSERKVIKKYWALVEGDFPFEAELKMPIKRSNYGFEKYGVSEDGKFAWSQFKRIAKYKKDGKFYSMVEINLKTGRTHQIRVHLSYLRWPIVGDKLYGGKGDLGRQFLHARSIEFLHPQQGKLLSFESQLSNDLMEELQKYEKL